MPINLNSQPLHNDFDFKQEPMSIHTIDHLLMLQDMVLRDPFRALVMVPPVHHRAPGMDYHHPPVLVMVPHLTLRQVTEHRALHMLLQPLGMVLQPLGMVLQPRGMVVQELIPSR